MQLKNDMHWVVHTLPQLPQLPQLPCQQVGRGTQLFCRAASSDKHRPGWGCRSTRTKLGLVKWKIVKNGIEFQILSLRLNILQVSYCKLIWNVTVFILQYYMDSGCSQMTPKNQTNPDPTRQHPIWPSFWIGSYQFPEYYFVVNECDE